MGYGGLSGRKSPAEIADGKSDPTTRYSTIGEATASSAGPAGTEAGSRTLAERLAFKNNVAKRSGGKS